MAVSEAKLSLGSKNDLKMPVGASRELQAQWFFKAETIGAVVVAEIRNTVQYA